MDAAGLRRGAVAIVAHDAVGAGPALMGRGLRVQVGDPAALGFLQLLHAACVGIGPLPTRALFGLDDAGRRLWWLHTLNDRLSADQRGAWSPWERWVRVGLIDSGALEASLAERVQPRTGLPRLARNLAIAAVWARHHRGDMPRLARLPADDWRWSARGGGLGEGDLGYGEDELSRIAENVAPEGIVGSSRPPELLWCGDGPVSEALLASRPAWVIGWRVRGALPGVPEGYAAVPEVADVGRSGIAQRVYAFARSAT